jgi:hypothetical protein
VAREAEGEPGESEVREAEHGGMRTVPQVTKTSDNMQFKRT